MHVILMLCEYVSWLRVIQ